MRLIDGDKLMEELPKEYLGSTVHDLINSAPSIEIVRCGECKWLDSGKNDSEVWSMCTRHFGKYFDVNADDFCSYGSSSEKPNNSMERSSE